MNSGTFGASGTGGGLIPTSPGGQFTKRMMWAAIGTIVALFVLFIGLTILTSDGKPHRENAFWNWVTSPAYADRISREQLEARTKEQEMETWFKLNGRLWQGVTNYNPNLQIVGEMKTVGLRWKIRLDKNDELVFHCTPRGWVGHTNLVLPDSNINEWMLEEEEIPKEGMFVARLQPRNTIH